jgi:hypothetical protein
MGAGISTSGQDHRGIKVMPPRIYSIVSAPRRGGEDFLDVIQHLFDIVSGASVS